jgi:hypothetical protein
MLEFTDVDAKISWKRPNRQILREALPPKHPLRFPLLLANAYADSTKLIDSFLTPLLYGSKKRKQSDVLLPQPSSTPRNGNRDVQLAYPSWYTVPSVVKDDIDDPGGQRQARPSCTHPAAQTFPRPIRTYKSRWREGCILAWDQSQHELRTAALLSGDEYLVSAYRRDADLHAERAIQIYGDEIKDHPDFRRVYRQAAKHANFTDLNWGQAHTLQHTILTKSGVSVPLSLCEEIVAARPVQRPGLFAWQTDLVARARRETYIELPFTGHSRRFIFGRKYKDSEVVNFPIQAVAAITLQCMEHVMHDEFLPELNDEDPDCFLFLNHYDALYFDCKTRKVAERVEGALTAAMAEVEWNGYWGWMQNLTGYDVPLKGDCTIT